MKVWVGLNKLGYIYCLDWFEQTGLDRFGQLRIYLDGLDTFVYVWIGLNRFA